MTIAQAISEVDLRLLADSRYVCCGGDADEREVRVYVRGPMPEIPASVGGFPVRVLPIESVRHYPEIEEEPEACPTIPPLRPTPSMVER